MFKRIIAVLGTLAVGLLVGFGISVVRHRRPAAITEDLVTATTLPAPISSPVTVAKIPEATAPPAPVALEYRKPVRREGFTNEASLMAKLHELAETNPPVSLQLAREGNARFPDSADAPARTWIIVKSLVNMARFDEARDEARKMVKKYPNNPLALDVQRHLLSNPL